MADVAVLDVRLHDLSVGTLTRLGGDSILFAFDEACRDDEERATNYENVARFMLGLEIDPPSF